MQIRTRLTLQFFGIVAFMLFFSLSAVYYLTSKYREDTFYLRLKEKALTAAVTAATITSGSYVDSTTIRFVERAKKDIIYKEHVAVFDSSQKEISKSNEIFQFDKPKEWFAKVREDKEVRFKVGEIEVLGLRYYDEICKYEYIIFAGAVDLFGNGELRNLRNTLLIVFMLVVLASAIAGWVFAGRALRPISDVINQVDSITESNLSQRLQNSVNKDEIHRLTHTFNNLLDRIERAFIAQKSFVANASHELKNLLTIVLSQLEVTLLKDRSKEEYFETLSSVTDDIRRLSDVSNRLLELARISGEKQMVNMEEVRIDDIIFQTRADVLRRNPTYRIRLNFVEMPENDDMMIMKGNEALLHTAFLNLIENGCKFSDNHEVSIRLEVKPTFICLNFSDKGIGIPAEELPYIFDAFYRSRNTREIQGHGIGLSLVHNIISLHGGTIEVKSKEKEGSDFKILFKRQPEKAPVKSTFRRLGFPPFT